jgi:hypothetical protein
MKRVLAFEKVGSIMALQQGDSMNKLILAAVAAVALPMTAFAQAGSEKIGAWTFKQITDPMTDASRGIAHTELGGEGTLVVKCDTNGDNEVYFSFLSTHYLGGVSRNRIRPVGYRLDGTPARELSAHYDGKSATVIAARSNQPGGKFLIELSGASKLTLQLTDFNSRSYVSIVDVSGAREAIRKVASTCRDNATLAMLP